MDGLPFLRLAFSIICHGWYSLLLKNFPVIELSSPIFLGSCGKSFVFLFFVSPANIPKIASLFTLRIYHFFFFFLIALVVIDHFIWFFYFTTNYHPFSEIATFFAFCVWLVPFQYFISLSANEYALPSFGNVSLFC